MGASIIPAPSVAGRNWVEIASSTPTGVATVSFTSLASYNYYRVTYSGDLTADGFLTMKLNNSTSNYVSTAISGFGSWNSVFGLTSGLSFGNVNIGVFQAFMVTLDNTSGLTTASGTLRSGVAVNSFEGAWFTKEQINRIDLTTSAGNFSTGTIKVYGSN
jgi:hypothetical protein